MTEQRGFKMNVDVCVRRRVSILMVGLAMSVGPAYAQAPVATALTYDAVSVKPNKTGGGMMRINQGSDMYSGTNVTLKMLVRFAYDLTTEDQISGLSGAMASDHFDIEAKMDADTVATLKKMSKDEANTERRKMMQAMLADRFQMKVHHEQKELGMYDLVIAKGGFKLQDADPNDPYPNGIKGPDGKSRPGSMNVNNGKLTAQGVPISNLSSFLAQQLHKQVVDKTGLKGTYDFTLKWQPDDMPMESKDATGGEQAPSIFTALQEELGLRLDATKGLVDMIAVDHVEMPSEN